MDPENPRAGEQVPLKIQSKSIFLRRSIRGFEDRQPKEGALGTVGTICCSLAFAILFLAFINMLSIAAIVIGVKYLDVDYCPGEPNMAKVLIASGVLAIVLSLFEGRERYRVARINESGDVTVEVKKDCCDHILNLIRLVKFGLFIYLCVLVYSLVSKVTYEPGVNDTYCHPVLYLFSFWSVTVVFMIIGIFLFCGCCLCCCIAVMA